MPQILIIDDDEKLIRALRAYFRRFSLPLDAATRPHKGLQKLNQGCYDMVILDIMLPDLDGFTVCRKIRTNSDLPILMLSARGEAMDRVTGLEIGADDYLAKPFEPRELVARVQNILKRTEHRPASAAVMSFENLEIDPTRQQVKVMGEVVSLTAREYGLLHLLARHAGQRLSRDEISAILRGSNIMLFSRAVDIQVSRLRGKLKPLDYIKTVWGAGYQFVAPGADDDDG